eukprot:scaffold30172_cov62-Phaeocystis_antarctica.AAC.2
MHGDECTAMNAGVLPLRREAARAGRGAMVVFGVGPGLGSGLGLGVGRQLLEHHLDLLSLVALLDAVLVVAHEQPDVVALVVLVLALAQAHDARRLGRSEVHHVLELERADLLAQLLEVKRPEALASQVGHPGELDAGGLWCVWHGQWHRLALRPQLGPQQFVGG